MAVIAMSKIGILLHKEFKGTVLELLQKKGVMEISKVSDETTEQPALPEDAHKIDLKIAEVEFALDFLRAYAPSYKGVEGLVLGDKTKLSSLDEVDEIRKSFVYGDVVEKCKNIEERLNQINATLTENAQTIETLLPWQNLDLSLNGSFKTKTTKLIVGFLKTSQAVQCLADFRETFPLSENAVVEEFSDRATCWFLVEQQDLREVEALLQKYEFTDFALPKLDGTAQEVLEKLEEKQAALHAEIESLNQERAQLAQETPKLKVIYDYLNWLKSKEEVKQSFDYTVSTVNIQGFLPQKEIKNIETELAEIDTSIVLEELEISKDDQVPVELENSPTFQPFENVMKLFGLPSSQELDPTPYLTPFFLIFFGFCLTDVGYGLILGLGLLLVLKFVKLPADIKNMLRLLMWAGWATVLMGVLFGGYMGLTTEQAPAWMVNAETGRFKLQIFDPITNLNPVMAFAYGLGLVQLWLGIFLKGLNALKNGFSKAFQTAFIYNILIVFGIFWGLSAAEVFLPQAATFWKYVVYATVVISIWGSGYGQKNVIVRPLIGLIVFVQEVINVFSAVLSYSRLFALGLATGIIALVFNTIALTTLELLPIVVAVPLMIIIILLGHSLNIALNVLGAFIHSARLQFVEFFGKFLEGGGKEYVPFKRSMKYIVLDKD